MRKQIGTPIRSPSGELYAVCTYAKGDRIPHYIARYYYSTNAIKEAARGSWDRTASDEIICDDPGPVYLERLIPTEWGEEAP